MPRARDSIVTSEALFQIGDSIRVRSWFPRRGHVRTPYYLRGKTGRIVHCHGAFLDPALLAEGNGSATFVFLYQVDFLYSSVWHDRAKVENTIVSADLYENWLEGWCCR